MSNSYKPGGGNKPQPYIPAGNGEESGEYTNKFRKTSEKTHVLNCYIKNIRNCFNFYGSKLVGKVTNTFLSRNGVSMPNTNKPNSVAKKIINGYIVSERYYNETGEAYLDIDYTCHGNPKRHPCVPHIHRWQKSKNGKIERGNWEEFQ